MNEYKCKNCGFIFRTSTLTNVFCPKCSSNAVDLQSRPTWQSQAVATLPHAASPGNSEEPLS